VERYYKKKRVEEIINRIKSQINSNDFVIQKRSKNTNFIHKLGWLQSHVLEYISSELEVVDYIAGPEPHHKLGNPGSVWKFGKRIETYDVYIKVWDVSDKMICISFHESDRELNYYFSEER